MIDLTPSMTDVLANIGKRSVTAHDMGVNGGVLKRLWQLDFLTKDWEAQGYFPPYYSLSEKGKGAAAVLNGAPVIIEREGPVAQIKRVVCEHFRIPVEEMVSARRSRKVARPRQIAMYLTKRLTPKSLPDIGRQFGHRDHTTVIHAVRVVERMMGEDHNFKDEITTLAEELGSKTFTVEMVINTVADPALADA